jgi:carboxylesterase
MDEHFIHNPHLDGETFFWEGGAQGVLLFHGLTATTVEVRRLAQNLLNQGFTVAGPLLPGHGTTPADLNRTHWKDLTQAGEAMFRRLQEKCESIFVGGESAGAVVALYLASQHPEIKAVLLYAPAIRLDINLTQWIKLHIASWVLPSVPKEGFSRPDRWQGYPVIPTKGAVQLLKLQQVTRRLLPRIHQPVLVVQGRGDRVIDPRSGETILKGVKSKTKELHWMEHSCHTILLDDELEAVTDLTLRFMRAA